MAITKESAHQICQYIVDDFESAWIALVEREGHHKGGGNFMFALLAMILLAFACRLCAKDKDKDKDKDKLARLTSKLNDIDSRYFTRLPGRWGTTGEFTLPGTDPECQLLGMMFDLIRNGKAHQYRSAIVKLSDGREVDIDLTGAASNRGLTRSGSRRPRKHLRYRVTPSGDVALYVRTDQLFLDIKNAIEASHIVSATDEVIAVVRASCIRNNRPIYRFTSGDFVSSLEAGGHRKGQWTPVS